MQNESPAKPTLTAKEAKWAAHVAGLNARTEAAKLGADPRSLESVMAAGLPDAFSLQICGGTLGTPSIGHLLLFQKVKALPKWGDETEESIAILYAMLNPAEAFRLVNSKAPTAGHDFAAAVFAFSLNVTAEDLEAFTSWLSYHFGLIGEEEGTAPGNDPGAEPLPTGQAPAAPTTAPGGSLQY